VDGNKLRGGDETMFREDTVTVYYDGPDGELDAHEMTREQYLELEKHWEYMKKRRAEKEIQDKKYSLGPYRKEVR